MISIYWATYHQYLKQSWPLSNGPGCIPIKLYFLNIPACLCLCQLFFPNNTPFSFITLQLLLLQTSNKTHLFRPNSNVPYHRFFLSCYYNQFLMCALQVILNYLFPLFLIRGFLIRCMVNIHQKFLLKA